jgi:hypothetical protein
MISEALHGFYTVQAHLVQGEKNYFFVSLTQDFKGTVAPD